MYVCVYIMYTQGKICCYFHGYMSELGILDEVLYRNRDELLAESNADKTPPPSFNTV